MSAPGRPGTDIRPAVLPARLAPSAPDAEQALIGALLLAGCGPDVGRIVSECLPLLQDGALLNPVWSAAWRSIQRRALGGESVDLVLVAADIERDPDGLLAGISPDEVNAALFRAGEVVPAYSHAQDYAVTIHREHLRRSAIELAGETARRAYQHTGSAADLHAEIAADWMKLDALLSESETGDSGAILARMRADAAAGVARGRLTGMAFVDRWIGGCVPGHVWTLGGSTSVGKTWLACSLINGLIDNGARVGFISLEMPAEELMIRILAGRVGPSIAYRFKRTPGDGPATWSRDEMARLAEAEASLADGLRIFERVRSLPGIQSCVRKGGYDVAVVDYGQLIEVPGLSKEYEVNTAAAHGLQSLSKTAGCTIIVTSQVSQQHVRTGDADDAMGFKSSGAWGEIADLGLMLRRDKDNPAVLQVSARKNRHGPDWRAGSVVSLDMDRVTGLLSEKLSPFMASGQTGRAVPDHPTPFNERAERRADKLEEQEGLPHGWN